MMHVNFQYQTKDGTIKSGTSYFYEVKKAVRFVYAIRYSKDKRLISYGADDPEEHEEMNRMIR